MKIIACIRAISLFGGWLPPKLLKVMKLTIVLLMITFMQVSAKVFRQNISLNEKDVSLEKVLKSIKKQSGYVAFYEDRAMENARPVTIKVNNASLQELLDYCFANQALTYQIKDKTILIMSKNPSMSNERKAVIAPVK